MNYPKTLKVTAIVSVLVTFAVIYFVFDPSQYNFFPPCPFTYVTHLQCPGCGSQRAVHQLLHLDVIKAFSYNPLMVIALPYLLLGLYFEYGGGNKTYPKARKTLFGQKAMLLALVVIILYWIGRNIF